MLAEEKDEVDPAEEDTHGTELPLPAWQTLQLKVAHEHDGGDVEKTFQVVNVLQEVFSAMVNDLDNLYGDACQAVQDDNN